MHHQKSQPTRPVTEKSSRGAQVSINPVFLLFWLISAASQLQDFKSCYSLRASRIDCADDIWAGLYVAPFPILYYGLQEPPYATLKRAITAAIKGHSKTASISCSVCHRPGACCDHNGSTFATIQQLSSDLPDMDHRHMHVGSIDKPPRIFWLV